MGFSIRRAILALTSPDAVIAAPKWLWSSVVASLRSKGDGERESGCFLLGDIDGGIRYVRDVVYFDELDARCETGHLSLDAGAFTELWKICEARGMAVVADVHTHPGVALQSDTDERNPAISQVGHVAMIVPEFAMTIREHEGLGVFVYRGRHQWATIADRNVQRSFALRNWL